MKRRRLRKRGEGGVRGEGEGRDEREEEKETKKKRKKEGEGGGSNRGKRLCRGLKNHVKEGRGRKEGTNNGNSDWKHRPATHDS